MLCLSWVCFYLFLFFFNGDIEFCFRFLSLFFFFKLLVFEVQLGHSLTDLCLETLLFGIGERGGVFCVH